MIGCSALASTACFARRAGRWAASRGLAPRPRPFDALTTGASRVAEAGSADFDFRCGYLESQSWSGAASGAPNCLTGVASSLSRSPTQPAQQRATGHGRAPAASLLLLEKKAISRRARGPRRQRDRTVCPQQRAKNRESAQRGTDAPTRCRPRKSPKERPDKKPSQRRRRGGKKHPKPDGDQRRREKQEAPAEEPQEPVRVWERSHH